MIFLGFAIASLRLKVHVVVAGTIRLFFRRRSAQPLRSTM
jgi:hypothetical protein